MTKHPFYIFFLLGIQCFSQASLDSLDLSFSSEYEENILTHSLLENSFDDDFLGVLFAIDSTYTLSKAKNGKLQVDQFLKVLEPRAIKYNEKKRVKYLFDQIHDRFFRKYELDANFSDIFKTSTYNCVTGTALYAYVFDYFKIPYQIKETPTHVFLVAYPKRFNIFIETTLPGKSGSYAPSDGMIKKAVDELVEMKIITQGQVVKNGYSKAFNDYYYGDENISKKELAGIQYYNKAVAHFNTSNYSQAYDNILKSRLFYTNEKTKLFSEGLLALVVDEMDFEKIENFKWFLAFTKIEDNTDFLKYKLANILTQDTWANKEHDSIEARLNAEIDDEDLKIELLETTYNVRADRYSKLQQYKKALLYAEKIYKINPNNLTAKNYICESMIISLANKNMNEERLKDLDSLVEKYPFITDFGAYLRYKIYLYSFLTSKSFSDNKSDQGLEYLAELEKLMDSRLNEVDFSQEAVGNAYGAAGAYYYRKQRKSKAVDYLERGLRYSPDNDTLNRKLKLIENSN